MAAGALAVTAYAPLQWWWLIWPCLIVLLVLAIGSKPWVAFRIGFAWGLGIYLAGISWLYVSLHVYGGMPLWMGSVAVLLFASVIALFIAAPCALTAKLAQRCAPTGLSLGLHLSLLVSLLLVFEWAKSWVLTGFPWLDFGYTQTSSWLFALAPVGGVYLISFYVLATSALIAYSLLSAWTTRSKLALSMAALLCLVVWPLGQITWTNPIGEPVQVGIVQPNTPVDQKWQGQYRDQTIRKLAELSQALVSDPVKPVQLLVWPETALALSYQQTDTAFWQTLVPQGASLVTGLIDSPNFEQSYNAAVLVCNGRRDVYRKRHLVPFGEYLPLRFLFNWVLEYLQLPMSDFSAWQEPQLLACGNNLKIGLSICYEDAFAGEHRVFNADSTVLINISEDAWFGDSLAPHQRLQMAQMRAHELSKPMVRSANSGPSALISKRGEVMATTAQFEVATLSVQVQPQQGATPYQQFGNWIVWLAIACAILLLLKVAWRQP